MGPVSLFLDGVQLSIQDSDNLRRLVGKLSGNAAFFAKIGSREVDADAAGTPAAPKTATVAVWPILGCLKAAEEFVGKTSEWGPVNDDQREFLDLFGEHIDGVDLLSSWLERRAGRDVAAINAWLRERGFDISLSEIDDADGFAVASILDVLVEWLKEGTRTKLDSGGVLYDGVKLKDGVRVCQHPGISRNPVVRISTRSGVTVCMSVAESEPEGRWGLLSLIRGLQKVEASDYRYEGVVFPMVSYDRHEDISCFKGLGLVVPGREWFVSEAVQQTRFRMNEKGARAESAAAMTLKRCCVVGPEPYVIDRPFVLWMEADGLPLPLFAGVFAEDVWKDPKGLEDVRAGG
jgi:hypothetical protein